MSIEWFADFSVGVRSFYSKTVDGGVPEKGAKYLQTVVQTLNSSRQGSSEANSSPSYSCSFPLHGKSIDAPSVDTENKDTGRGAKSRLAGIYWRTPLRD